MLRNQILGWLLTLIIIVALAAMAVFDGPWRIPDDADLSGCKVVNCETFP